MSSSSVATSAAAVSIPAAQHFLLTVGALDDGRAELAGPFSLLRVRLVSDRDYVVAQAPELLECLQAQLSESAQHDVLASVGLVLH